ncbi:hypothetical protein NC651_025543 [Populus alba x Populus x berolinensis]|nr:hypothetical protein NC651_025543 [Populus alba x Populus x berolinensis]
MEHLREIRPRCQGGDGLQPTGARRWKLLELVAEQFGSTRPFFSIPSITTRFSLTATCRLPLHFEVKDPICLDENKFSIVS